MVWKLDVIVDIAEKGLGKVVTSFYATMLLTGCPNCRKPLLLNVNYSESLSAPLLVVHASSNDLQLSLRLFPELVCGFDARLM